MLAQFGICVSIWIAAFVFHPMFSSVFEAMFYSYWPFTFLVTVILGLTGESGMISGAIYGILLGIVAYGVMTGFIVSIFKRKSDSRAEHPNERSKG